jgi:hypothetical protein
MPDIKAIVIRGDFTEDEFALLVKALRFIDTCRPTAHLEIVAVDPTDHSLATAEALLRAAVPPDPDRQTDIAVFKRVR